MKYYSRFIGQPNIIYKINKDIFYSLLFAQAMHTDLSTMLGYTEVTNAVKLFTLSMADFTKLNLISQAISIGDDEYGIESSLTADKKLNKIRFDPICSDPNKSDMHIYGENNFILS